MINIFCKYIVRYVIVEIKYNVFEEDFFLEKGFEICKVEVYGMWFWNLKFIGI